MSLPLRLESPEVELLPMTENNRTPLLALLVQGNPLEPTASVSSLAGVPNVLERVTRPYVASGIIKTIVVLVVQIFRRGLHSYRNLLMHCNWPSSVVNYGISASVPHVIALFSPVSNCIPLPLHQPIIVNGINYGEFPLSERNEASICIHVGSSAGRFCLMTNRPAVLISPTIGISV